MRCGRTIRGLLTIMIGLGVAGSSVWGQDRPWETFDDLLSDSLCDVVNTANAELVLLDATGQLVIVTGSDVIMVDTYVDGDGNVCLEGLNCVNGFADPVGFIDFVEDGDGLPSVWWTFATGTVVQLDDVTLEPFPSGLLPSDFTDVPCDACPLWDDPSVCQEPPVVGNPPFSINICGSDIPISFGVTVGMLSFMRLSRWRTA